MPFFRTAALLLLLAVTAAVPTITASQNTVFTDVSSDVRYTVERYAIANYPVALAFAPDGRLFYTEKVTGSVRVINADGTSQIEPVITLPTSALQERGLLGITLDPEYAENGYIWIYHTAEGSARDYPANRVVRFREENGVGSDPQIMLNVPITNGLLLHNGGNLYFDAQGRLYVSIGDYGDAVNAQDLAVPQGKIHRFSVEDDELVPAEDNPFPDSSIWAYGLRNPFDFTFDPYSDAIFATENGPDCDDEINLILGGFNYGWREDYACVGVEGAVDVPLYMAPLLSYSPTEAPTGITVYASETAPAWDGSLFFCVWNFAKLRRAILDDTRQRIVAVHDMDLGDAECRMDVIVSPDGDLFFTTLDAIYKLTVER